MVFPELVRNFLRSGVPYCKGGCHLSNHLCAVKGPPVLKTIVFLFEVLRISPQVIRGVFQSATTVRITTLIGKEGTQHNYTPHYVSKNYERVKTLSIKDLTAVLVIITPKNNNQNNDTQNNDTQNNNTQNNNTQNNNTQNNDTQNNDTQNNNTQNNNTQQKNTQPNATQHNI